MGTWSIKIRLALGASALFVAALGLVVHVVLSNLRTEYLRTIGSDLAVIVSSHGASLDNRFENARQVLESLANAIPDQAFFDPLVAQNYVHQQIGMLDIFDLGLYVGSRDEFLLAVLLQDQATAKSRIGKKTAASATNRLARETRQFQISPPYPSQSCGGCPAVAMIYPKFAKGGDFLGFVTGAVRLDGLNFLAALKDVRIGQGGYLYLLSHDRTMIMHPDPKRLLKLAAQPGQNKLLDKALDEGFEGHDLTVNSSGIPMVVAFHHLKSTGWILAANYPQSEAEAPFQAAQNKAYAIALAIGLIFLALVWLSTRHLLAPLSALTRHVANLPEGQQRQIQLGAVGEIGTLERAFNTMMANLDQQSEKQKAVEAEIRHLNTHLEQLVSSRTAALEKANRELAGVITRLTNTQQDLVEAQKLAALGALVAGIAHELNTPIGNCVLVASDLSHKNAGLREEINTGHIRKSILDKHLSNQEEAYGILLRNLDKAAHLIASFKQVAVDRTSDIRRSFELHEVVADTLLTMHPTLKHKHCILESSVPTGIAMDSYPGALGRCLGALVENAVTHAYDESSGTIRVAANKDGDSITLTISDQGKGISPENLPRVFEPFFTTRLGQGGSGLGLHIVYNVVTQHLGGKIAVSSTPGQGTCFTLILPAKAPD